jgi:FkbM family methyltransferase
MDRQEALLHRPNYGNSLRLLQKRGFAPKTVIDAGAAEGGFFLYRRKAGVYPGARHFFVDAMQENEAVYRRLAAKFEAGYEIAALSSREGETTLRVDPEFYNTHIEEVQADAPYRETRRVRMRTLDALAAQHRLEPPYALMMDVQGAEVEVLRGAPRMLESSIVVTTEIQAFSGRDTLTELLPFMAAQGWTLYDITDLAYFTDWTFYQCYATFIPRRMDFRKASDWTAPEEREEILAGLRERRVRNLEEIEALVRQG